MYTHIHTRQNAHLSHTYTRILQTTLTHTSPEWTEVSPNRCGKVSTPSTPGRGDPVLSPNHHSRRADDLGEGGSTRVVGGGPKTVSTKRETLKIRRSGEGGWFGTYRGSTGVSSHHSQTPRRTSESTPRAEPSTHPQGTEDVRGGWRGNSVDGSRGLRGWVVGIIFGYL